MCLSLKLLQYKVAPRCLFMLPCTSLVEMLCWLDLHWAITSSSCKQIKTILGYVYVFVYVHAAMYIVYVFVVWADVFGWRLEKATQARYKVDARNG